MKSKAGFLLYLGAGLLFFIFWLFVVFPYDALKSRVVTEIENHFQGRYRLDIGSMDVSLFGSVTFKNLKVLEGTSAGEKTLLNTPKLKLGFSPFALMSKKVDLSMYLQGSKGDIDGDFRQDGDEFDLSLNFDQFPIAELGFIASKLKVGLKGSLDGDVEVLLNKADPSHNAGKIDVHLINFTMDPVRLNLDPSTPDGAMEIPAIKLSGAEGSHIQAEIQKDNMAVNSIQLTGGDLDLSLDGRVALQGVNPGDYRLALKGSFKLTEALSKALPFLFIIEQQKNAEGVYPLNISGRLGKPGIRIGKFDLPL